MNVTGDSRPSNQQAAIKRVRLNRPQSLPEDAKPWDVKRFAHKTNRENAAPTERADELHDVLCDKHADETMLAFIDCPEPDRVHLGESFFVPDVLGRRGGTARIAFDNDERPSYIALPLLKKNGTTADRAEKAKGRGIVLQLGEVYAARCFGHDWPMKRVQDAAMWTARLAVDSGAYPLLPTPLPSLVIDDLLAELRSDKEVGFLAYALEQFGKRLDIARTFVPTAFHNADKRVMFTQTFAEGWFAPSEKAWAT